MVPLGTLMLAPDVRIETPAPTLAPVLAPFEPSIRPPTAAEEHAGNLIFRESLNTVARVEHDDAVATANKVAFQNRPVSKFNGIGHQRQTEEAHQKRCQ